MVACIEVVVVAVDGIEVVIVVDGVDGVGVIARYKSASYLR